MEWSGVEWSGVKWSGVEWSGVEWSGVEWSGVEWSGVEWSGVEWSGVVLRVAELLLISWELMVVFVAMLGGCCVDGLGDGDTGSDGCSSRVVVRAVVFQRVFWDKIHYMVVTVLGGHQGRGGHTSGRGQEH